MSAAERLREIRAGFQPAFWVANFTELFERLAYYGMVLVLGLYLVDHLGIRPDLYGTVLGIFTGALYLLPIFAGALADRFGYKPALVRVFNSYNKITAVFFCKQVII